MSTSSTSFALRPFSNRKHGLCGIFLAVLTLLVVTTGTARAGLTMELHFYRTDGGNTYSFYTPLLTNSLTPAAPLGTYLIQSPHQPTNGSVRGFQLTASGMQDLYSADSEHFYGDFDSAIFQITNGPWTLLFTNSTTTNTFHFTVSASPSMTSNMLPVSSPIFPLDGATILTNETNFSWQGPASWPGTSFEQAYNLDGYYTQIYLPFTQSNWAVDSSLPTNQYYTFSSQNLYTNTLFAIATPIDAVSAQPFNGWNSYSILEDSFAVNFSVVATHGIPTHGHTLLAHYTFEDNSLFVHDFAGRNDMSYAWFSVPPTIVTNDAAAGTYAGGLGGSGWFTPPDSLKSLFEKSFSVSLWLKTTNVAGSDTGDLYSSPGVVSDLGDDYSESSAPMIQTGHKLGFYTGGNFPNVLHSHADITTGQYVHVVTTRDQLTGEKQIYVNGVLDAMTFASTNVLTSSSNGDLTVGYNNGQVFKGQVDEIQFYAGVLSSNDVAFLHAHPGTNVADVLQLDFPAARFDFEDTNNAGMDSSLHNNNADCSSSSGSTNDVASTNAMVGAYARQFFGDTHYCFSTFVPGISNALSHDFTVTAWVNTTNSVDVDFANAYFGMPILFAYSQSTNGTVPLSITGSKAAFTVSNPNGTDTTIHSVTSVNDGRYHFLAVTRNQNDGVMRLYVDGALEASGVCNTAPIEIETTISLGGGFHDYTGLLDDVRVYSSALSPDNVANLASNGALTFANVLGTSNIVWNTSGNSPWIIEATNTYNGAQAALQSGSISDNQTSAISATITGPGAVSFVWQNPTVNNLDLEFDLDGGYQADISSFTDWTTAGPFSIGPGQHTISWTAYANGDTDMNEAAFLAQVSFTPTYLVAHFDFESTNAFFPIDVSSNGNDMNFGFGFNGGGDSAVSTNAAAGVGSVRFFKNPSFSFSGGMLGWKPSTPPGLLQTLAGSFSVSLWIKTTNHDGAVGDAASDGAPIVSADVLDDALDSTPVALTGGAVAFGTGGTPGDDTLTSTNHVNDNNWHHVVVTRDQTTGQKRIFIDGTEDPASPGVGVNGLLNAPQLLSIGTRLDASHSDPSSSPIYTPGYDGSIDDVQIYSRPLNSNEVAFLYTHPGLEVTSGTQDPVPYDVEVRFEFHGNAGNYWVFPMITSINPPPASDARITSPNGAFIGTLSGANSSVYTSLNDVIQECNGTNWLVLIDEASANARELRFSMTVTGLDPSDFPPVTIYTPADGSVNVGVNPLFTWSGPATFQGLDVVANSGISTNFSAFLDPTVTNWTSPKLNYGTNQFFVNYTNTLPTISISMPMDFITGQPLSNWVAGAGVYISGGSTFVVGAPAPLPVHLGSFQHNSASFQFSFTTLAGRPHVLQGTTNLSTGPWVNITNFLGDGSQVQFSIPNTNLLKFFRISTQ